MNKPLNRQLYEQLRQAILLGAWTAGARLPTSRQLAEQYDMARMTVQQALDQLQAEGYIVTRPGAGVFVTDDLLLPDALHTAEPAAPRFSHWGGRLQASRPVRSQSGRTSTLRNQPHIDIDFGFGRSFATIFPYDIWRKMLSRYLGTDDAILTRYGSIGGFEPLREAIATYVSRWRQIDCTAEQVVIVNGIQQAIDIVNRLFINRGDEVLVEEPGYVNAYRVFQVYGAKLRPLPVDDDGFPVESIPADSRAKLVFVTPANQFPRGGSMPLARRLRLLAWAKNNNAYIVEDDYDGELRYDGHPLASLRSLDQHGRVIYLGSFSKVLFPALRVGYVVLPPELLRPFLQTKQLMDRGAPTLTQAAVADFIANGHFERHVRKLRKAYGPRHAALCDALGRYLDGVVAYNRTPAGLQMMLRLPAEWDETAVIEKAASAGVAVYGGTPFHLREPACPSLMLGFSGLDVVEIDEGIARLGRVMDGL